MIKQLLLIAAILPCGLALSMEPTKKQARTERETTVPRPPVMPNPTLNGALFDAVNALDAPKVAALIQSGAELNAKDATGATPLFYATWAGQAILCQLLIDAGANPHETINGGTPLCWAIEYGHLSVCELLIGYNVDLDAKTQVAPLHHHPERGPRLPTEQILENTALQKAMRLYCEAIARNSDDRAIRGRICKLLIEKGANVNFCGGGDVFGEARTPLESAAFWGLSDICSLLIKNGAHVNKLPERKLSPLHWAVMGSPNKHKQEICALLIEKGALVDVDHDGETPLYLAAGLSHIDIVELLLKNKAAVNRANNQGWTPLHYAVDEDEVRDAHCIIGMCTVLLKNGADRTAKTSDGSTPLHLAAAARYKDALLTEFLINKGALVHARDNKGRTALHLAVFRKCPWTHEEDQLENWQEDMYADKGEMSICKALIEKGADVNAPDNKGRTPLHRAAKYQQTDICKLLVEAGADIHATDLYGQTPLHLAAESKKNNKNAEYHLYTLASCGANMNARNHAGATPLLLATAAQYQKCTTLLSLGAEVNAAADTGATPFDVALHRSNPLSSTFFSLFESFILKGAVLYPAPISTESLSLQSTLSAFCLLRRIGVPRDVCYAIFTSISPLRNDFMGLLMKHMQNCRTAVPLTKIPSHFRPVVCDTIYNHTLEELKKRVNVANIPKNKNELLRQTLNGDRMYALRIAQQLGMTPPTRARGIKELSPEATIQI